MRAPTHTSFSILFLLGLGLLVGITVNPVLAAFAVLGALLPDIDTEKSAIGRLFPPLSAYLERKLGHRQATHSLLALVLIGLVFAPLIQLSLFWWIALLSGYLSHLQIDTANKGGVPLFYPSPVRAVMPKSEKWRIAVGSKAEIILFTVISVVAFLLLPINRLGLFKSLHYIIKDTRSAIADYRSWAGEYKVYANIGGTFNVSQQPIVSQFEVLGIVNQNSLVVYDVRADVILTVGTDKNANIYPKSIRCIKGEEIDVITNRVHLENELLGNVINHIPESGQTYILGIVKTTDKVILPKDPDTCETIRPSINEIELRYARERDFENVQLSTIFVLSGDLYLRTILPQEATTSALLPPLGGVGGGLSLKRTQRSDSQSFVKYASFNSSSKRGSATALSTIIRTTQPSAVFSRVQVVDMYLQNVKNLSEILIKEGQYLKAGDLVAKLSYDNEAKLAFEEQSLIKLLGQLKATRDDVSSLFITEAERRLSEIQEEQKKYRIYSAVNGRILLLRTHVIHNNNLTIAIKLLVNAPSPSSSSKPIPNPQIEPPLLQKERPINAVVQPLSPQSDNLIKAMERKAAGKAVSFFKNTPYRKKTHTKFAQFLQAGGQFSF